MAKVTVTINGQEVSVEEGLNMIEAARKVGVEIPHFCYHPGLGVDGNCRMCLVEQEGVPKPQIACNTFAKDGLKIRTDTPRVKELQAAVLEFLFLNHPLDCPICDQSGECSLQDYYMSNGQYESRLDTEKRHKRKVVEAGPRVTLDAERCVLCTRCIRFCDQVVGTGELYIVNRGNRAEISTYPGKPLANDYSLNTVDVCPVGALTSTDFRFKKRVWFLKTADSICTGCARGCNIYLEHDDGVVYRLRPRENMQVNRYWMCDPGRLSYKRLNDDRLDVALEGEKMLPLDQALALLAGWIEESGGQKAGPRVLALLSADSPVESLFAWKRFAKDVLGGARVVAAATRPDGVQDQLLRRADLHPNRVGASLLGLLGNAEEELKRGGDLLLVQDGDPFGHEPGWRAHQKAWKRIVYLGANENESSRCSRLALPTTPHSESSGTFVNFEGRVQRFERAVAPRGDALSCPDLLHRVGAALGVEFGWAGLPELWADLGGAEAGFRGVTWDAIGAAGVLLPPERRAEAAVQGK